MTGILIFSGKKLQQTEYLKFTTVVERAGRTYRFNGMICN